MLDGLLYSNCEYIFFVRSRHVDNIPETDERDRERKEISEHHPNFWSFMHS